MTQERPDGTYIWHASLVLLYYLQVSWILISFDFFNVTHAFEIHTWRLPGTRARKSTSWQASHQPCYL